MNIDVIVVSGMNRKEHHIGTMRVNPNEVETACGLFGSTYILKMGLHFDRYVVSNSIPNFQAVPAIYTSAAIAATITRKGRAQSVSGNIGESIAGLVARRKLGARMLNDVLPVLVPAKKQAPDFVMKLRPMFPASFETATTMVNPAIGFARWPVESKAVSSNGQAGAASRSGKTVCSPGTPAWKVVACHAPTHFAEGCTTTVSPACPRAISTTGFAPASRKISSTRES